MQVLLHFWHKLYIPLPGMYINLSNSKSFLSPRACRYTVIDCKSGQNDLKKIEFHSKYKGHIYEVWRHQTD